MRIGAKRIETRPRKQSYRGLVALHSAVRMPDEGFAAMQKPAVQNALAGVQLMLGFIFGCFELIDCVPVEQIVRDSRFAVYPDEEFDFGNYSVGRYALLTRGLRVLPQPISYKGMQGLVRLPDDVAAYVDRNSR